MKSIEHLNMLHRIAADADAMWRDLQSLRAGEGASLSTVGPGQRGSLFPRALEGHLIGALQAELEAKQQLLADSGYHWQPPATKPEHFAEDGRRR